ncbi:MAG TPA: glycosyltransferase family 4 protein [Stellaceae bacterium]|nr:glycosyltransferase family 4 protein [Stellaceae bacterium]
MTPILLHVFPSFSIGGQQTRFATIANRLGRRFRHLVISLDGRQQAAALLDRDLDFTLLPLPAMRPIARLRRIVQMSGETSADALITYNWGATEWAMVNRVWIGRPHIHLEDGFGADEADRQKRRRVWIRSLFLRRSAVVVPSRTLAGIAVDVWRLDPRHVHYIPNGIDPGRFDNLPRSGDPFFRRRDDECVIGSFSPLRREKNIARLLRVFAQTTVPPEIPTRLIVCGDGPERAALEELARRLGIAARVTFTGHVPRSEAVMGAFDILAMTSDTEQMPYAVLEAMAARLPVLATDVGDIAMMVAEKNRPFIVARDDPDRLAEALATLCAAADLRRRLGCRNRRRVEQAFGIDAMVEAFDRLLSAATAAR